MRPQRFRQRKPGMLFLDQAIIVTECPGTLHIGVSAVGSKRGICLQFPPNCNQPLRRSKQQSRWETASTPRLARLAKPQLPKRVQILRRLSRLTKPRTPKKTLRRPRRLSRLPKPRTLKTLPSRRPRRPLARPPKLH